MKKSVYPNLEAELTRKSVTRQAVADVLDTTITTASLKLIGKAPIKLEEAFKINNFFFDGAFTIEYLFKKEGE